MSNKKKKDIKANDLLADPKAMQLHLDTQLLELETVGRKHWQKNKEIAELNAARIRELELQNLQLHHVVAALEKPSDANGKATNVLKQQHQRAAKLMIARDEQVRVAEAENYQLRETLSALAASGPQSPKGNSNYQVMDLSPKSPMGPTSNVHFQVMNVSPHSPKGNANHQVINLPVPEQQEAAPMPPQLPSALPEIPSEKPDAYARLSRARLSVPPARNVPDTGNDAMYQNLQLDKGQEISAATRTSMARVSVAQEVKKEEGDEEEEDAFEKEMKELEQKLASQKLQAKKGPRVLDLKERMKDMAMKQQKNAAKNYYKKTGLLQFLARHRYFDFTTTTLILMNSIWLGVDCALNDAEFLVDSHAGFIVGENIFCLCFMIELLIRFGAFERKFDCLKDIWFIFDSAIVLIVAGDVWVMFGIMAAGGSNLKVINPSLMRLLRLLRLTRVARIIRLLHAFPEIMVLIRGLAVATRSVLATVSLLSITVYIFAIAFTQVTRGTDVGQSYFKSLGDSVFTLFFQGCFGDDLSTLGSELFEESFIYGVLFLLFVLVAPLTIMNVLVGVLVEVIRLVAHTEQESVAIQYVTLTLEEALKDLHAEGDSKKVSVEEFSSLLQKPDCIAAFKEINIDAADLLENSDVVFGGEESLLYDELMDSMLTMRGTNHATVKDMIQLRKQIMSEMGVALDERLLKQMKALA